MFENVTEILKASILRLWPLTLWDIFLAHQTAPSSGVLQETLLSHLRRAVTNRLTTADTILKCFTIINSLNLMSGVFR